MALMEDGSGQDSMNDNMVTLEVSSDDNDSDSAFSSCLALNKLESLHISSSQESLHSGSEAAVSHAPRHHDAEMEDEFGDFVDSETSPISILPFQPKATTETAISHSSLHPLSQ